MRNTICLVAALLVSCLGCGSQAFALEHVLLRREGKELQVDGRLLVKAQDGGLLILARDGVLWAITPDEQVKHAADKVPFEPLSRDELWARLKQKLPRGFDVHQTAHYMICHNTSRAYAQWCGSLFERLYMAFTNYWSRKGFELRRPEFPLVAVVFSDARSYGTFSRAELGEAAASIVGYYSLETNRMTMYDLTGIEAFARFQNQRNTTAQINRILARPEASHTVATIVHEATHQIAFNCGLHARYSDCPRWFSEGIAVYFETPDLSSSKGWRNIGGVNRPRLTRFRLYLRHRPADSLVTLIRDSKRFTDSQQSLDAYAETWALTYFLIRQRPKQYIEYLKLLSEKKPLVWDTPERRVKEFTDVFGDLKRLDFEFLRYIQRVR